MDSDDKGGSAYASRTETKLGVVDNSFNKGQNSVLRDIATQLNCFPTHSSVHRKLDTLRADNERMREALEKIAHPPTYHDLSIGGTVALPTTGEAFQLIARNTLKALSPNTKDTPDDTELR